MKQWKSSQSCNSDELINNIAYNNETLALIIENETNNKKRIELRSLSTFDPLWSTSFNAAYHFTPWNNRVCVLKYNEWLVIDYGNSRLFHVSKDGQVKANRSYKPRINNAILFDLPVERFRHIFKYLARHDLVNPFERLNQQFDIMFAQQPLCLPNNQQMTI
ncbi:unnamed protein product [Rotaria magnacalcarata]|uniref:Uncharacterized protein n=1 Tax=Rotaria magnacalcarata TaxID=392030 RepID=A0A816XNA5_9BILA|nr:unnamed protein product [Rotaria magnacalcarata]